MIRMSHGNSSLTLFNSEGSMAPPECTEVCGGAEPRTGIGDRYPHLLSNVLYEPFGN